MLRWNLERQTDDDEFSQYPSLLKKIFGLFWKTEWRMGIVVQLLFGGFCLNRFSLSSAIEEVPAAV
jgi:hypothetical protein